MEDIISYKSGVSSLQDWIHTALCVKETHHAFPLYQQVQEMGGERVGRGQLSSLLLKP